MPAPLEDLHCALQGARGCGCSMSTSRMGAAMSPVSPEAPVVLRCLRDASSARISPLRASARRVRTGPTSSCAVIIATMSTSTWGPKLGERPGDERRQAEGDARLGDEPHPQVALAAGGPRRARSGGTTNQMASPRTAPPAAAPPAPPSASASSFSPAPAAAKKSANTGRPACWMAWWMRSPSRSSRLAMSAPAASDTSSGDRCSRAPPSAAAKDRPTRNSGSSRFTPRM